MAATCRWCLAPLHSLSPAQFESAAAKAALLQAACRWRPRRSVQDAQALCQYSPETVPVPATLFSALELQALELLAQSLFVLVPALRGLRLRLEAL